MIYSSTASTVKHGFMSHVYYRKGFSLVIILETFIAPTLKTNLTWDGVLIKSLEPQNVAQDCLKTMHLKKESPRMWKSFFQL